MPVQIHRQDRTIPEKRADIHQILVLRQSPDRSVFTPVRFCRKATLFAQPAGYLRVAGLLSGVKHQQEATITSNLSLFAYNAGHYITQSGLAQRHHLDFCEICRSVSGGNHQLGDPQGFVLSGFQHPGCELFS